MRFPYLPKALDRLFKLSNNFYDRMTRNAVFIILSSILIIKEWFEHKKDIPKRVCT